MPVRGLLLALLAVPLFAAPRTGTASVPLRADFPAGGDPALAVPVAGGVPFPPGVVADSSRVRLLRGTGEVPAQADVTAVWPDGSVKWLTVTAVLAPADARGLRLEYGPGVARAAVPDPVAVPESAFRFRAGGRSVELRLRIEADRVRGPDAFAGPDRRCLDPGARSASDTVDSGSAEVEFRGPVRARVVVRGEFRLPGFGTTLPDRVRSVEPPERVPFTLRVTVFRGLPLALVDHSIVFTGEPDRDFLRRWSLVLPGRGTGEERLVLEPGLVVDRRGGEETVVPEPGARLCRARIRGGVALLRDGFEDRPALVGGAEGGDASVDFWPREAGPFDLRRYAREWATGECGDTERPEDMERYARYAARGLAKSQRAVLWFGEGDADAVARSLAEPALLTAPPGFVAASGALGRIAPRAREGRFAEHEAAVLRAFDWFRFNQELYRWHGKLAFGFFQTRMGEIHRHDRWDSDYGRWGWSLNDGAGRVGHALMLAWLRTLSRRYFRAGEAFCRASFDLSMIHTELHLENARDNWWRVKGTNHRHNVQPFGCPYTGMRGSAPGGHRILYHLTGDGTIGDGLDLVSAVSMEYATTRPGAFGGSGSGPDGQGAGAEALLVGFERTGDPRWLAACRTVLDQSRLFPPPSPEALAPSPDFGLFLAAVEYADLSGDEEFRGRLLAAAQSALQAKPAAPLLTLLAYGARETGEERFRERILRCLGTVDVGNSLAELPPARWPGHGGARHPPARANFGRDLPYVVAVFAEPAGPGPWPEEEPDPVRLPAEVPGDWFRPGGAPGARDRPPDAERLLAARSARGTRNLTAGRAAFRLEGERLVSARLGERECLAGPVVAFAEPAPAATRLAFSTAKADGAPVLRLSMAVKPRARIESFGVRIPLALSGDARRTFLEAGAAFRTERWRVDMNDEVVPRWLNSDSRTRWPLWRGGGILLGPAGAYRIYRLNRPDTSPVFVDGGFGAPGWFDVTDRGGAARFGLTARCLPGAGRACPAVSFDHEARVLVVEFHSGAAEPLAGGEPAAGTADLVLHEGWRPPLSPPELARDRYMAMLDDLDYGGNIGLFALRFLLSETHQVGPGPWKERLADLGVEPRELLLSMEWRDGLRRHCERRGVPYDPDRPDESVRRLIAGYR